MAELSELLGDLYGTASERTTALPVRSSAVAGQDDVDGRLAEHREPAAPQAPRLVTRAVGGRLAQAPSLRGVVQDPPTTAVTARSGGGHETAGSEPWQPGDDDILPARRRGVGRLLGRRRGGAG